MNHSDRRRRGSVEAETQEGQDLRENSARAGRPGQMEKMGRDPPLWVGPVRAVQSSPVH